MSNRTVDNKQNLFIRGFSIRVDERLCYQAIDDYLECLDEQNAPLEKINKFKCINELYQTKLWCPVLDINRQVRNHFYVKKLNSIFTKSELEYLNLVSNYKTNLTPEDRDYISKLSISKI